MCRCRMVAGIELIRANACWRKNRGNADETPIIVSLTAAAAILPESPDRDQAAAPGRSLASEHGKNVFIGRFLGNLRHLLGINHVAGGIYDNDRPGEQPGQRSGRNRHPVIPAKLRGFEN